MNRIIKGFFLGMGIGLLSVLLGYGIVAGMNFIIKTFDSGSFLIIWGLIIVISMGIIGSINYYRE